MRRGHEDKHHHNGNGGVPRQRGPLRAAQWQGPQRASGYQHDEAHDPADLDPEESAFVESFAAAGDPVSFLRLACIPFEAVDSAGRRLALLRVECETAVAVGKAACHAPSGEARSTPLPGRMATRRRQVRFIYADGGTARSLTLGEVRGLTPL